MQRSAGSAPGTRRARGERLRSARARASSGPPNPAGDPAGRSREIPWAINHQRRPTRRSRRNRRRPTSTAASDGRTTRDHSIRPGTAAIPARHQTANAGNAFAEDSPRLLGSDQALNTFVWWHETCVYRVIDGTGHHTEDHLYSLSSDGELYEVPIDDPIKIFPHFNTI